MLAARLTALGHAVVVQPMMRIVFLAEPTGLAAPAAIAFTSANAVRAVAGWIAARSWRDVVVYAVGGATAEAARVAGFGHVTIAAGDAAGLAAAIRNGFDPRRGTILYPAARDRAADLAALLPGFAVATVQAYRANAAARFEPAAAQALRAGAIDGVLVFSRRTAEIFVRLILAEGLLAGVRRATLYALSAQVAEPLAALAPAPVEVAPRPDLDSLVGLLKPALAHPP